MLRELATDTGDRPSILYVPALIASHLRLLLGMVRANRPWRLAARLYGALVAALAVGAYGLVASDVWRLSSAAGWWRLLLMCVLSIAGTVAAVIVAHGLWERAPDPRVRGQVALFNVTTTLTVAIGIACLYLALFVLILGAAELLVRPSVFDPVLGHPARHRRLRRPGLVHCLVRNRRRGLGAGLESREAVREAAYTTAVRERARRPAQPPLALLHPGLAPAGRAAPGARGAAAAEPRSRSSRKRRRP